MQEEREGREAEGFHLLRMSAQVGAPASVIGAGGASAMREKSEQVYSRAASASGVLCVCVHVCVSV